MTDERYYFYCFCEPLEDSKWYAEIISLPCFKSFMFPIRVGFLLGKYKNLDIDDDAYSYDIKDIEDHEGFIEFKTHKGFSFDLVKELAPLVDRNYRNILFFGKDNIYLNVSLDKGPIPIVIGFNLSHVDHYLSYNVFKSIIADLEKTVKVKRIVVMHYKPIFKTSNTSLFPINYNSIIGWMTYFGEELVNSIGITRFENLTGYAEKEKLGKGYLVSTTFEPFNSEDSSHLAIEEHIIKQLFS
jgi:hypothetical protein